MESILFFTAPCKNNNKNTKKPPKTKQNKNTLKLQKNY